MGHMRFHLLVFIYIRQISNVFLVTFEDSIITEGNQLWVKSFILKLGIYRKKALGCLDHVLLFKKLSFSTQLLHNQANYTSQAMKFFGIFWIAAILFALAMSPTVDAKPAPGKLLLPFNVLTVWFILEADLQTKVLATCKMLFFLFFFF